MQSLLLKLWDGTVLSWRAGRQKALWSRNRRQWFFFFPVHVQHLESKGFHLYLAPVMLKTTVVFLMCLDLPVGNAGVNLLVADVRNTVRWRGPSGEWLRPLLASWVGPTRLAGGPTPGPERGRLAGASRGSFVSVAMWIFDGGERSGGDRYCCCCHFVWGSGSHLKASILWCRLRSVQIKSLVTH